jgi:hypothetical protein
MKQIEVFTQEDLDRVLRDGHRAVCIGGELRLKTMGTEAPHIIVCPGAMVHVEARDSSQPHVEAWDSSQPRVEAWESSQPHVVAWESSQPHVVARDSSQPHVVAWESSQPHVVARDSSQPRVEAWESSQPHVEAWDSSQPHVEAWDSSQPHVEADGLSLLHVRGPVEVRASDQVVLNVEGSQARVVGGIVRAVPAVLSAEAWCKHYGLEVSGGVVILLKAVDYSFTSPNGVLYLPGSTPEAKDWDGGRKECGGGLHFGPSVSAARGFNPDAQRYLACPVQLSDCRPPGENDRYPQKIKARGCCAPVYEVDIFGRPVAAKTEGQST